MGSTSATRNIRGLTFIQDGRWNPSRLDDARSESELGRAGAEELFDLMEETMNPAIFGSVMRVMTESGVFKAFEVSFCSRIGILLVACVARA